MTEKLEEIRFDDGDLMDDEALDRAAESRTVKAVTFGTIMSAG